MNFTKITLTLACFLLSITPFAQTSKQFVSSENTGNAFVLTQAFVTVPMLVDSLDYAGSLRASRNLREDIGRVIGKQPGYFLNATLNYNANRGLRYAVSFDGGEEQIVNINQTYDHRQMKRWQANSINSTVTTHIISASRKHTLRFRALDPGMVPQKIMIDTGNLKPSYLGAPESKTIKF
ncbi:hypothetical protein EZS27_010530 [termite gut metagenome]|uniref:Gylcosyl hydrolase 115 C-terminal domain-containing protein n=1 Tax=termite gut metagenome TaxID=433724 RepID=A0A5J4S6H5_9ZZZZ